MSLANAFRLSFYLSLAMSCACLFYGEWDFHPWITGLLPVVVGFMALALFREGREYLSEQAANRLGTVIGVGTILWIVLKVPRSDADLIAGGVPWPAALVPLLAPLLPILLLVKLFRPKKITDFWIFHAIALIIVTLSCILAGEALFFVLLIAFLMAELWCLSLFFLYRNMILARESSGLRRRANDLVAKPDTLFGNEQLRDPTPIPTHSLRSIQLASWSAVVLMAGITLFLFLPRFTDSPWVPSKLSAPGRTTLKSGIDAGMGIDPYREGTIEMSKEPAFEVAVLDHRGGPGMLPQTQRWRVQVLDEYRRGHWQFWRPLGSRRGQSKIPPPSERLKVNGGPFPEGIPLGMQEGELFLIYHLTAKAAGGLPLAEPAGSPEQVGLFPQIANSTVANVPLFTLMEESDTFMNIMNRSFSPREQNKKVTFGQMFVPKFLSNEFRTRSFQQQYVKMLLNQEVPTAIQDWTRALVRKLPALEPADYGSMDDFQIVPAKYAKVAKALTRHLAESGEFTYSLRLTALGVGMDPTAEFLLKVKEGHCERFAAGLTLMLRSLGIPARIVRGYSGCELLEEGKYVVRKDTAHSWVEALVPGPDDTKVWLQLDPTPSATTSGDSLLPFLRWAWARITNPDFAWKNLVMDYNTDRQTEVGEQFQQLWHSVKNMSARESTWESVWGLVRWPTVVLLGLMSAVIGRSLWRYRELLWAGTPTGAPRVGEYYARLLTTLRRYCQLQPKTGQTPLEFAHSARAALAVRLGAEAVLAEVPVRAVQALYRQRFGGGPLTLEITQTIDAEVRQLEAALRQRPTERSPLLRIYEK